MVKIVITLLVKYEYMTAAVFEAPPNPTWLNVIKKTKL